MLKSYTKAVNETAALLTKFTFTYFQVNRIFNVFNELLAPACFFIDESLEVQNQDRRQLFQSYSSTNLYLAEKKQNFN